MSELPGRPDLEQLHRTAQESPLSAVGGDARGHREAERLIARQYDGRPQLRAVLDAVLAALPQLGPVTVQVRKTLVSVSTPRRVFALVRATTRSRVDLGLRLDHERPGGRLLAARDIGAANVRIPLTRPEEVDAEVLGWLRCAYLESAAPAPARRPGRRPAPALGTLTVLIDGYSLPGRSWPPGAAEHHNVHIALSAKTSERPALVVPGRPWLATEPVPGDAPSARWEVRITVRRDEGGFDFSGPHVRGDRGDRHLFLAWGDVQSGTLRLIRGSKLKLASIDPSLVAEAARPGQRLVARIRLTGAQEGPALSWSVGSAGTERG